MLPATEMMYPFALRKPLNYISDITIIFRPMNHSDALKKMGRYLLMVLVIGIPALTVYAQNGDSLNLSNIKSGSELSKPRPLPFLPDSVIKLRKLNEERHFPGCFPCLF